MDDARFDPQQLDTPALWPVLAAAAGPAPDPARQPWAGYWLARLDTQTPVAANRQRLQAVLAGFEQAGDTAGCLLCLAAIIEGYYVEEGPLDPLDGWIARLQAQLPAEGAWPAATLEAQVMACGLAIRLRSPQHPLLAAWADRGGVLVRQLPPGASRLKLATFLGQYHLWRGDFGRSALVVDTLPGLGPQALTAGLPPTELLAWLDTVANHARYTAQHARAREAVDAALALVQRHGLQGRDYALRAYGASTALAAHDLPRAQAHLQAMRPLLDGQPQADQTHYWHYSAGLALLRGDAGQAVALARTALENSTEIGGPTRLATHGLSLGQAQLLAGEPEAALHSIALAEAQAQQIDATLLRFTAGLMRAACLLALGRDGAALAPLREAWAIGAAHDFRITGVWWLPQLVGRLAQRALQQGIEPAYVRRFVQRHALPGTDPTLAEWPWPLALRGLGGFEVWRDGELLARGGGKAAQRPLDLLRLLLAQGGMPLPVATALQALWPEAEPAAQRKAFDVALLRLRRLLGDARLLQLEGGRLQCDARWVYSDVAALQHLLQQTDQATTVGAAQRADWCQRLLALMRGPFLPDEDSDWAAAARTRLRRRCVLATAPLAEAIAGDDPALAARLLARVIDVDPLAETLVRQLMRLHGRLGEQAEAWRAWQALRAALHEAGGLAPAPETQALALQLGLPAGR